MAQEGVTQLCPLPGTAGEVREIYRLLKEHDWEVEDPYTEADAIEENVKRVHHPTVLHLATHGYFDEDASLTDEGLFGRPAQPWQDPMLRSGLYFGGADRALRHEATVDATDDGVLTALEASGLNLHGTELVVLSACNTGLGDATSGEGVLGLRRSLQQAGARSVLMSMWSVPDAPTRELMERFYSNWLSGMDKHSALRSAQLEMKKQTSTPYSWGAFVLIGP
jgi:CHAT domain-containing protein